MMNMKPFNSTQNQIDWGPSPSPSRIPIDFSPPLIAMVVVVATAFFIVTYFRLISRHLLPPIFFLLQRWRNQWLQWRHHPSPSSSGDIESLPSNTFDSNSTTYNYYTSYNGLDENVIKTIPLSTYTKQKSRRDCAVCLLEFEEHDYVRTLPACAHAFHVDCIDVWLSCHANCPLCRAGIFLQDLSSSSPFVPLMAARIRPSLDGILESILSESQSIDFNESRIETSENHSLRRMETEERRDFLKRSYSFGFERFERSLATDRIAMEAATATPWRYRRGNFWSKRPSPFNAVGKHRVFSFRYYRGMKSPFSRRRSSGLFPLSESNVRYSGGGGGGGGGGSSRRSKSMITSPMFMRSTAFSSSRLRCGDLEALLSPERLNRR